MIELALNKLQKYYGATMVLEDITFEVQTSEKVGIVGCNGCGKTTLLKVIMGIEGYEKGMLSIRKGAGLGYLEQMPSYPENFKVIDVLNTAFEKVDDVYKELKKLEHELSDADETDSQKLLNKYSKMQTLYESLGGYEREEKLSKVCTGLKINGSFKERLFASLSGGEKTTVILGKILLQKPDILLLDEPTNHLDMEAMEWLEGYLKEYSGVVIMVSHDRYFLDNVATKIIEIEDMVSKSYDGNYTAYVNEKEKQIQLQFDAFEDQQKKIKAMEKTIAQLRDWAARGDNNKFIRRAVSMEKRLEKIQRIEKPALEKPKMDLNLSMGDRSGNDVIVIDGLYKSFGYNEILKDANLLVRYGERAALIGSNGCGKSTLLKILIGEDDEYIGKAQLGSSINVGYLPQQVAFNNEELTVLECFRENKSILEGKAREYLSKFMFYGESVFKKVKNLSGGERSRLKLALLTYEDINLLILDEPTNHFDIDSIETLEETLKDFEGTIFFVSHDRYFINNLSSRVVELKDGVLKSFDGNYEYYKSKKAQKLEEAKKEEKKEEKPARSIAIKVKGKADSSKKKANPWVIKNLEEKITELEGVLSGIDNEMAANASDYEKLNELYLRKSQAQQELDEAFSKWMEAQ
jgi:ATP-binding cassette, subfamily F, member 3